MVLHPEAEGLVRQALAMVMSLVRVVQVVVSHFAART